MLCFVKFASTDGKYTTFEVVSLGYEFAYLLASDVKVTKLKRIFTLYSF
jgi:hypothetical protein